MKKAIMLMSLILFFTSSAYGANLLDNKKALIKANNFYGYTGDVKITVNHHDANYGTEGGMKNVGVTYDAYFDILPENQKIIFYKSDHAPELEIQTEGKKTIIYYNKKKIYDNFTGGESKINPSLRSIFEQYPWTILWDMPSPNFAWLINLEEVVQGHIEDMTSGMGASDPNDEYAFQIDVDKNLRILRTYIGDNSTKYKWKNGVVVEQSISSMPEQITIKFLNEKGWHRRGH